MIKHCYILFKLNSLLYNHDHGDKFLASSLYLNTIKYTNDITVGQKWRNENFTALLYELKTQTKNHFLNFNQSVKYGTFNFM